MSRMECFHASVLAALLQQSSVLYGRGLPRRERHNKGKYQRTDRYDTMFGGSLRKSTKAIQSRVAVAVTNFPYVLVPEKPGAVLSRDPCHALHVCSRSHIEKKVAK